MGDKRKDEKNRKVFVGGLSEDTDKNSLRQYMSRFGEIEDCVVMIDRNTSKSRGFGFVTFLEFDDTQHCLKQDSHVIDNKEVEVKRATPRDRAKEPEPVDKETTKVFVGGISPDTTKEDVMEALAEFNVVSAQIMTTKGSEKPRGFAFAYFDKVKDAKRVAQIKWIKILDRDADCKLAVPKEDMNTPSSKGGAEIPRGGQPPYQGHQMDRYDYGRMPVGLAYGYGPSEYAAAGGYPYGSYDYRSAAGYAPSPYDLYSSSRAYMGGSPASGMMGGAYGQSMSAYGPSRGSYSDRDRMASRSYTHPYTRR